jgi:hypothetical protein
LLAGATRQTEEGSAPEDIFSIEDRTALLDHQSHDSPDDHGWPDQVGEHTQPAAPGEDGRLQRIVMWRYSGAEPRAKHSRYDQGDQRTSKALLRPNSRQA